MLMNPKVYEMFPLMIPSREIRDMYRALICQQNIGASGLLDDVMGIKFPTKFKCPITFPIFSLISR